MSNLPYGDKAFLIEVTFFNSISYLNLCCRLSDWSREFSDQIIGSKFVIPAELVNTIIGAKSEPCSLPPTPSEHQWNPRKICASAVFVGILQTPFTRAINIRTQQTCMSQHCGINGHEKIFVEKATARTFHSWKIFLIFGGNRFFCRKATSYWLIY